MGTASIQDTGTGPAKTTRTCAAANSREKPIARLGLPRRATSGHRSTALTSSGIPILSECSLGLGSNWGAERSRDLSQGPRSRLTGPTPASSRRVIRTVLARQRLPAPHLRTHSRLSWIADDGLLPRPLHSLRELDLGQWPQELEQLEPSCSIAPM